MKSHSPEIRFSFGDGEDRKEEKKKSPPKKKYVPRDPTPLEKKGM